MTSGWQEVVAGASLATGRARARLDDPAGAREALETAVERAERFQIPGLAWRAHAQLAAIGPPASRASHHARATELVQASAGSIEDEGIRRTFLEGATAELSKGG
jgi:hypothetical protein